MTNANGQSARMRTGRPAQKVVAASLGGAVSVIVIYLLTEFTAITAIPVHVQAAITTIITFATGYYVPPAPRDQIEVTMIDPAE